MAILVLHKPAMLRDWTVPSIVDNIGLQNEVCAKASRLTPPANIDAFGESPDAC
jgi:hypothetical protein